MNLAAPSKGRKPGYRVLFVLCVISALCACGERSSLDAQTSVNSTADSISPEYQVSESPHSFTFLDAAAFQGVIQNSSPRVFTPSSLELRGEIDKQVFIEPFEFILSGTDSEDFRYLDSYVRGDSSIYGRIDLAPDYFRDLPPLGLLKLSQQQQLVVMERNYFGSCPRAREGGISCKPSPYLYLNEAIVMQWWDAALPETLQKLAQISIEGKYLSSYVMGETLVIVSVYEPLVTTMETWGRAQNLSELMPIQYSPRILGSNLARPYLSNGCYVASDEVFELGSMLNVTLVQLADKNITENVCLHANITDAELSSSTVGASLVVTLSDGSSAEFEIYQDAIAYVQ